MSEEDLVDSHVDNDISVSVASETAVESSGTPVESTPSSESTPQLTVGAPDDGASPESQAPAGQRPTALATDPLKELNDFKAQSGRERADLQRQLQQFQTQQQQWNQAEAKRKQDADRLQLKRWDPKHPEHSKFGATMAKKNALSQQLRSLKDTLTPEQFSAVAQRMTDDSLNPSEQSELQEHYQMNQEFLMNPVASAREQARAVAQEMIREAFHGFQQHSSASQDVQRDISSVPPQALGFMKSALESGASYDLALQHAQMAARLQQLEGQQSQSQQTQSHVTEQARLNKSKASVTRDPKPAQMSQSDIYSKAKQIADSRGISTADSKFSRIVAEVEAQSKVL
jgi:enoyl-CoA hydratase/carnithine racemase